MAKKGFSRADWLEAALAVLERDGVDGVKVDRIARELGISRSGFYWHFRNRADFLDQLLEYWVHEFTGVVINNPDIQQGRPEERLLKLIRMVDEYGLNRHDPAMVAWGECDPRVREVFDQVYATRVEFVGAIFSEIGFRGDDLGARTRMFVSYTSWEKRIFAGASKQQRLRWFKVLVDLLTRK